MNQASTILLVEDNEDDIYFMQRALKGAALTSPLRVVMDGQDAIDYLGGRNQYADRARFPVPAMVFLDLKLPSRDGFEVLAWIRQQQKSSVPVAILSSSPEEIDRQRAQELGANCYLVKPPDAQMLVNSLKQFGVS